MLDYRFIYLMVDKKGIEKIGIAQNVQQRRKQIEKSMEGTRLKILSCKRIFFAKRYEQSLHNFYDKQYRGKRRGSGKTEFFQLGIFDRLFVRVKFFDIWIMQRIILIGVIVAAYFILKKIYNF